MDNATQQPENNEPKPDTNTENNAAPLSEESRTENKEIAWPSSSTPDAGTMPETASDTPAPTSDTAAASQPNVKSQPKRRLLPILVIVLGLVLAASGGYLVGSGRNKSSSQTHQTTTKNNPTEDKELTIPQGATVIAECAKGRGTQYALPKDIPLGPVYNVYEGKVIGVEFMVGKDDLLVGAKSFLNLPLNGVKYDHVNIGLLSQGHAGFPTPHYHVDVMMVPTSTTDKITCT